MNDLNMLIGITLVVIAILGALVLGYFLGYNARSRHYK